MGCLFRLLFLMIGAAAVAVVVLSIERTPLLQRQTALRPAELRQAAALALRLGPAAAAPGRPATVTLSEAELNLLIGGWTAHTSRLAARAGVASIGVAVGATVALPVPENPLGRYLNIRALVVPSRNGLVVDTLSIGRVDIPSPLIRPLLVFLLDRFGAPGQGDALYASVRAVRVAGRRVAITFAPPADMASSLAGGGLVTGNPTIDALLRRASPAERQRVIDAVQRRLGSDPGAVRRALEAIRSRFGGTLPPIDDGAIQSLRQQFGGGDLPSDPAAAEAEIRGRLSNDPAARQQAIDALRQRGIGAPAGR
jgi:hypothetical protein